MRFLSEKTYKHFNLDPSELLFDARTGKQLIELTKQTPGFAIRAKKQIFTYYQGTDKKGVITFMTPSGTEAGKFYYQKLEMADLPKIWKEQKGKKKVIDMVRLALAGNLKMQCIKPDGKLEESFLYFGFAYLATKKDYNLGFTENRFPKVRNPKLKGALCKHLRMVMETIQFHASVITRDLTKNGYFSE